MMICPDGGTCHHECTGPCFRVQHCAPLSGVYPRDQWPEEVKDGNRDPHLPRTDSLQEAIQEALEITGTLAPDALGDPTKRPTLAWIISLAVREHEHKNRSVIVQHFGGAEGFHER